MSRLLSVLALGAAVLTLDACQKPTPRAPAPTAAVNAAGLARAQAAVDIARKRPAFVAPAEAFDAKGCANGKTMVTIPSTSAIPFVIGVANRMAEIGAELGLKVTVWQNQGQPSQWIQGVQDAIRNHADILDMTTGLNPGAIAPQIKAAKAAGIKVMTSHFYDPSQKQNPDLSSSLTVSFNNAGRLMADWSILRTQGAAKVLIVKTDEVPPTGPLVAGIRAELAANCPSCQIVEQINVANNEWGTRIQPSVQSALLAHPEINIVIPIYDSMAQFVVPAVNLAGRKGSVKIVTFNGTPFVLDQVRNGDVDMDIGESLDWIAYATLDGHIRDLCGKPSPTALNVPFYIFDETNVAEAGIPASYAKGYGDSYATGFRTLWGLKP